jgi:UPF0042 nucleotide-binding protein
MAIAPLCIVILTGQSGAGKSTAMRALEDSGYYCVDNLPTHLVPNLIDELAQNPNVQRVALGMDMREPAFLTQGAALIGQLRAGPHRVVLVFLQAQEEVLLRRYSQTRRLHPMDQGEGLRGAIVREQGILGALRELADNTVDTSSLTPHGLRARFMDQFGADTNAQALRVTVLSFGFKYGVPIEADMMLDVRFVANPFFDATLRHQTGRDLPVADFVAQRPEAQTFLQHTQEFLRFLLPQYQREGKCYFTLAIGCTGGRHRSVALAQAIAQGIQDAQVMAEVKHRDIDRDVTGQVRL